MNRIQCRTLPLLLAALIPAQATNLSFYIPNTYLRNIASDRYRNSGLLLGTSSSTGLCIGDLLSANTGSMARQLFSCDFPASTIKFSLVDPKTSKALPSDSFVMLVNFVVLQGPANPWKISVFDANHNLLETKSGTPVIPGGGSGVVGQAIPVFRTNPDISFVEFDAPGGALTRTSIETVHFDQHKLSIGPA